MLTVENVTKTFKSGDSTVTAVSDVSFTVPSGAFAAIVGKSGSGKSTLLAMLGALERPSSGKIIVGDEDITKLPDRKLVGYRRQRIGFIFQQYNLIPNLTALENVMLPMEMAGVPAAQRKERASALLDQVGLHDSKQSRRPARLSGGEQQRVAIARSLANKPAVIFADEPTGNLDSSTSKKIVELLYELTRSEGTTIIVVTHDLNMTHHTDHTFQLRDGKLIVREKGVKELLS